MERLFTVVFDLLVDAFSYDSTTALIARDNLFDADWQKGDITESKLTKALKQMLTAATYPVQFSIALKSSENNLSESRSLLQLLS